MNPRFTQTNVGKNAITNSKEQVMARRQGGPFRVNVPQEYATPQRAVQRTMDRRMNQVGSQQVPPEGNAIDRDINKRMERRQAAAQARQQQG